MPTASAELNFVSRNEFPESVIDALAIEPDPNLLTQSMRLLKTNPSLALEQFCALANSGSLLSMVFIGDAYLHGRGFASDVERGKAWLQRAADSGSIEGRYRLAKFYNDTGDYKKAMAERRKLAEVGYAPAMFLLGWMYYKGRGCKVDVEMAVKYWNMAEKRGHLLAKQKLSQYYRAEKKGFFNKAIGYFKLGVLVVPFIKYNMSYADSDRLRPNEVMRDCMP